MPSFNSGKKFRTPKTALPQRGRGEETLRRLKGRLTVRSKRLKITLPLPPGGKDDRI